MLMSNEPAVYKENRYGIRTENIIYVVPANFAEASETFFTFDVLTRCPFDTRAIDTTLLTPTERTRLNDYHKRVCEDLSPHLAPHERTRLGEMTRPI
jgi:Xaa-Pro aminopeptidase